MTQYNNIQIEKIQKNELKEVAELLTDAFEANPAYSLIFNGSDQLREGLFWLFKTNLILMNRHRPFTNVVKDQGRIIGAFMLVPPEGVKVPPLSYLQIGLFRFIRKFGHRTLLRMLEMDKFNKENLRNSMPIKDYYYLSMVAIKKEYQGKGIGSYVIQTCLNELSEQNRNCDWVALTTQLPENVVFYSRLGFEKTEERYLNYKEERYYNCNLRYKL